MMRIYSMTLTVLTGVSALALAPAARADDLVTYEIWSPTVPVANIEWSDTAGQHSLQNVPLPWRTSVMVGNARSDEALLRADWQPGSMAYPNPGRYLWVTLSIYSNGSELCENTVDVGESRCTGRGYYADLETPR